MPPTPFPRRRVPCPQARLEANATALRDEALALRRERAELARRNAALQGASVCPSPGTPARGADLATHPPGAMPGRVAQVFGVPLRPAEELAQGTEEAKGLRRRLEEAEEQRRTLRARGEKCEARQKELEKSL